MNTMTEELELNLTSWPRFTSNESFSKKEG